MHLTYAGLALAVCSVGAVACAGTQMGRASDATSLPPLNSPVSFGAPSPESLKLVTIASGDWARARQAPPARICDASGGATDAEVRKQVEQVLADRTAVREKKAAPSSPSSESSGNVKVDVKVGERDRTRHFDSVAFECKGNATLTVDGNAYSASTLFALVHDKRATLVGVSLETGTLVYASLSGAETSLHEAFVVADAKPYLGNVPGEVVLSIQRRSSSPDLVELFLAPTPTPTPAQPGAYFTAPRGEATRPWTFDAARFHVTA